MTTFQIFMTVAIGSWLLWWANTHNEAKAKRIARTGQLLLWSATLAMIAIMWQSPYVIFANDGPLGGLVADRTWIQSSAMGKVTATVFAAGLLVGAAINLAVWCFNKNKNKQ